MGDQADRIRIMRIITRMNIGGASLLVDELMKGLDPDRFEQRLYAGRLPRGEGDYLRLIGSDQVVRYVPGLGRSVRPGDDLRALATLTAEMRRFRPHIVDTHMAKAGALGRVAAALARVPACVHTFHGHLLYGYFPPVKAALVTWLERMLAARSDRLIAVGERVRAELLDAGVGRAWQYAAVRPGARLGALPKPEAARAALGLPAEGLVVAYVGRVTGIRRPDRLVDVARAVTRAMPGTQVVVCGSGDRIGEVAAAAEELGGALRLVGWRADVETVYAAADVMLHTADNDGMPLTLIEAALAGVPVAGRAVGSVAEIVQDGVTGLLSTGDTADLIRCVLTLLSDERLRGDMACAARERSARRFDPQRFAAEYSEVYASIAAERGWTPAHKPAEVVR